MAISETSICNAALGRIGSKRINDYGDASDTSVPAIQCRLHYEMTRDSLLRSFSWRFASARAILAQDATDPVFEWDNQFILPADFLRLVSIYGSDSNLDSKYSHAIEDQRILTNNDTMYIRYIKKVTDPTKFDPLFIEVLTLLLADKMVGSLAGGDARIQKKIDDKLKGLMVSVRALDSQEANLTGEYDLYTWKNSRF